MEKQTLLQVMEAKGTPTLKAIAHVFGLNPVRLYSVAKQPQEGKVYDKNEYNWDAIGRFVERRLDADKGPATLEEVIEKALAIDEELKLQDGRRSDGTSKVETFEVGGVTYKKRRFTSFDIESGSFIVLKNDRRVWKPVYQTVSHTVMIPVADAEGTVLNSEVKVISNSLLNLQGIAPSQLEKAVAERFEELKALQAAKTTEGTAAPESAPATEPADAAATAPTGRAARAK